MLKYTPSALHKHGSKQLLLQGIDRGRSIEVISKTKSGVLLVELLISEDSFSLFGLCKDSRKAWVSEQLG
jgi:hypothetical protein